MRLDQLRDRLGDQISIEWKSFLLRPTVEARSREKFVQYTESWRRPGDMEPEAKFTVWASDDAPPSHSLPALIAGKVAEQFGADAYDAYHHALLRAYFTDNRTISDRSVQVVVASEVGIDTADFEDRLVEQEQILAQDVMADHNQAVEAGISAVPTVVMAGALAVPGAQDVDTYERLVARLLEEAAKTASDRA